MTSGFLIGTSLKGKVAQRARAADQHGEAEGQVVELVVGEQHEGEEVVAPDSEVAEEGDERHDRPGEGQRDAAEQLEAVAAVDAGKSMTLLGNDVEK